MQLVPHLDTIESSYKGRANSVSVHDIMVSHCALQERSLGWYTLLGAAAVLEAAPKSQQTTWRPYRSLWRRPIPPIDKRSAKSFIRTNERIRAREIRVIDENGEQLGVMPPFDALKMAREKSLDLVEISPNAVPPVCKIQDYGKFLYEKDKSERAARKKQKVIVVKEVKFSVTVDEHDYQTKKNQAVRFLGEGDKVKASLRFQGPPNGPPRSRVQNHQSPHSRYRRCRPGRVYAAHGRYYASRDHCTFKEG